MASNIEVTKNANESTANLIRRFTKRVQGAGIIPRVRKNRYFTRIKSENVRKASRLTTLGRKEKYDELLKLGKIAERPERGARK
jgi:ribosomal protein S21